MNAILVAVSLALVAQQVYSAVPPFVIQCMKDNGVTGADVTKFAETGEASDAVKCNFKCVMQAAGAMTADGKFVLEPILAHVPENVVPVAKECITVETTADLCETAYRHNKCLRDKAPEFYAERVKASRESYAAA